MVGNLDKSAVMSITGDVKKRQSSGTQTYGADSVSLGETDKAQDATKIYSPPFFPIGETQGIYKLRK